MIRPSSAQSLSFTSVLPCRYIFYNINIRKEKSGARRAITLYYFIIFKRFYEVKLFKERVCLDIAKYTFGIRVWPVEQIASCSCIIPRHKYIQKQVRKIHEEHGGI